MCQSAWRHVKGELNDQSAGMPRISYPILPLLLSCELQITLRHFIGWILWFCHRGERVIIFLPRISIIIYYIIDQISWLGDELNPLSLI